MRPCGRLAFLPSNMSLSKSLPLLFLRVRSGSPSSPLFYLSVGIILPIRSLERRMSSLISHTRAEKKRRKKRKKRKRASSSHIYHPHIPTSLFFRYLFHFIRPCVQTLVRTNAYGNSSRQEERWLKEVGDGRKKEELVPNSVAFGFGKRETNAPFRTFFLLVQARD